MNALSNKLLFRFAITITALFLSPILLHNQTSAQVKLTQDTMATPIIGFTFGTFSASNALSTENGMYDLYKPPYLSFGIDATYKTKSNWLFSVDGNLLFGAGNNNLRNKEERMPAVFSHDATPIVIGTDGTDANVTCYNRALNLRAGIGKIFTIGNHNPNSGIVTRLYGGILQQKTIFMVNDVNAPQIQEDYARLYDHKRRGFLLTESLGYWFMSNKANFVNLYVAFEITQCWNHSVRNYVLDEYMGLHGPDNTKYLDFIYGVKICWMFPLKGKTAYDYYFY